jgi:hypothetical protein
MRAASLWADVIVGRDNPLQLPALEDITRPRASLVREALDSRAFWLVGPPKIGKTVVAHYICFLRWIAAGAPDGYAVVRFAGLNCARGIDLLLEEPDRRTFAVIFEDPFGREVPFAAADTEEIAVRLGHLREARPDLVTALTSRPVPYLYAEPHLGVNGLADASLMTLAGWYDPEELHRQYAPLVNGLDAGLARELACPALLTQFRTHGVRPGSMEDREFTRERYGDASHEITLDKVRVLESHPELARLAMVLLLQEYAFALPTVEEIDLILGGAVHDLSKADLVARTFMFDGAERLVFEHATTREAAELFLSLEQAGGFPLIGPLLGTHSRWLGRSLELWKTERAAARADWHEVEAASTDVQVELAARLLAHSGFEGPAFEIVSELDLDPWQAQDVAFELASRWSTYGQARAGKQLAQRLADDHASMGAYALLEALLYVRGGRIERLWGVVDDAFDDVEPGSARTRELLLGVDALAWRPPPEWHEVGVWVKDFLDRLSPDADTWGVVRFLAGYHPDGLAYLRGLSDEFDRRVPGDATVTWTTKQSEIALWLVQWHFVHQCRARAQFAHQPWVASEYLARTFHPEIVNVDRDRAAARLISSIAGSGLRDAAGWSFFLGENLRAVSPASFGDVAFSATRDALRAAGARDFGVIASMLTYDPDPRYVEELQAHFSDLDAQEALFDTLRFGLLVDGVRLLEPRFSFRRSLAGIYDSSGLDWTNLKAVLPANDLFDLEHRFDTEGFIQRIEDAAAKSALAEDLFLVGYVEDVLQRARCGDWRDFDLVSIPGNGPSWRDATDPYLFLFESAIIRAQRTAGEL